MLDDARKFVEREVRRGRSYHALLIDPPKFGRGPENEVWELFRDLPALMSGCAQLIVPPPASALMILTAYAIRASALSLGGLVGEALAGQGGVVETGELAIEEVSGGRLLGTSLFSCWSRP
jgi:23S rRNA (cytosine1962-C5)-methyltransferase